MFGHPRELEAFGNYKGLVLFFRKVSLDAIERFTKVRISLIPHSIIFLNPKFSKIMWKIKLQKIIGNFFDMIRKMYLNGMLT